MQTILGSRLRPRPSQMTAREQSIMLDVEAEGETVRLQGLYSPHHNQPSKGLVLLLHGWLGCITSAYMVGRGAALYEAGYSVMRLNFRDHGGTEALNEGFFHGCRLEEMFQATHRITQFEPNQPFYIVGFSMGGNFALRLAGLHKERPIANLEKVIAVCPSVDPDHSTRVVDQHPVYGYYFRRRWLNQLLAKEASFPHLYQFTRYAKLKTCITITEDFIADYGDFPNATAYFRAYAVDQQKLTAIAVPTEILTAADDPVIPVAAIKQLDGLNANVTVRVVPHGGHVGFVKTLFPLRSWLDEAVPNLL
ncbi:MAG: alpha/beta fold hydrolase [Chloroflexota bacterium]